MYSSLFYFQFIEYEWFKFMSHEVPNGNVGDMKCSLRLSAEAAVTFGWAPNHGKRFQIIS